MENYRICTSSHSWSRSVSRHSQRSWLAAPGRQRQFRKSVEIRSTVQYL